MTVWEQIYRKYQEDGKEYATLVKDLIPEFLEFIKTTQFKEKRVMDLGCGNGKYLVFLKELGFEVSGLDSSPTAITMAQEALGRPDDVFCADMYEFELPVEKYDLVLSIAAAQHGLKRQVAHVISQVYKSLMPGGYFFITLPDNEGSSHWINMIEHEEIEPGTRVPLSGPEKGLPHSSFTANEIENMFASFVNVQRQLLVERGRWIISGSKPLN